MKIITELCSMVGCNSRGIMEVDDTTAIDIMKRSLQLPCGHIGTRTIVDQSVNNPVNIQPPIGLFSRPENTVVPS